MGKYHHFADGEIEAQVTQKSIADLRIKSRSPDSYPCANFHSAPQSQKDFVLQLMKIMFHEEVSNSQELMVLDSIC